jgi:hypothetical protein
VSDLDPSLAARYAALRAAMFSSPQTREHAQSVIEGLLAAIADVDEDVVIAELVDARNDELIPIVPPVTAREMRAGLRASLAEIAALDDDPPTP